MDASPSAKVPMLDNQVNQKNERRQFLRSISNYFEEFSRNTSIHGFKYLANSNNCTFEKVWWLAVLFVCIYICTGLILMTLKKSEDPVFVSFHQSPMHMWDIPFPAVTVCPINKFNVSKYNFTHYLEKYAKNELGDEKLQHFLDMNLFCKSPYFNHNSAALGVDVSKHNFSTDSINFFLNHTLSPEDILETCLTNHNHRNCLKHFSPILTTVGLCFSFNMLDKSDLITDDMYVPDNHMNHREVLRWTFDDNYVRTLNSTFPLRSTRIIDGLFLLLRHSKLHVQKPCEKFKGFHIFIHHPAEMPVLFNRNVLLAPDEHYRILIKPDIMTTSSKLKKYAPQDRGCFYSNERRLKFFKIYTEHNCKTECAANYTIDRCGCAPYYVPHEVSTRICGLTDTSCVFSTKEDFLNLDMELDICKEDADVRKQSAKLCDCLPSCTSITYDIEISPERLAKIVENSTSNTIVHISFKDSTFVTMERNELFSNADFWASCGGLLGLFTGFSVISFAEIVYFLTLKWMCNLWNATRRLW